MPPPPPSQQQPLQNDVDWPIPKFSVRIDDLAHPGASIFSRNIDPLSALGDAVIASFQWLYHTVDKAPKNVESIILILKSMNGVAHTTGSSSHREIYFSLDHIKNSESRAKEEILGVLTHEVVHCYQYDANGTCPGGLIEGFADYVRLRCALGPPHWKRSGEKWDQGYEATAYFLDWIANSYGEEKVRELNERLNGVNYDEDLFRQVTGKSVHDLWVTYCKAHDLPIPDTPIPAPTPDWPNPRLNFRVEDLEHPGAELFFEHINPIKALKEATAFVFKYLYEDPQKAPNNVDSITLVLRPLDGVAYTSGDSAKEIHFSLNHIKNCESRARDEIMGVLTHEMVHCWQYNAQETCPGGLIEGMADFVRLKAKLGPPHWKRGGGKWDAGYEKTGFFLDWIGQSRVRELNRLMKDTAYDEKALFVSATGKTVETLWKEYCRDFDL